MASLKELDLKLASVSVERLELNRKLDVFHKEQTALYEKEQELLTEKYTSHISMEKAEGDMYALMQISEDAQRNRTAHEMLRAWNHSFDPHFLNELGRQNCSGLMPSASLILSRNETIKSELLQAISRYSSLVHGDEKFVIFSILEHTFGEHGSFFLVVSGEKFDRAEVVDYYRIRHYDEEDMAEAKSLEDALSEIAVNHWYGEEKA